MSGGMLNVKLEQKYCFIRRRGSQRREEPGKGGHIQNISEIKQTLIFSEIKVVNYGKTWIFSAIKVVNLREKNLDIL